MEIDAPTYTKVVILSASMGGGHLQVSRELARRLREEGLDVVVVDVLALTPRWGRFVRWLYPALVNHAPWLYEEIYRRFFLSSGAGAAALPGRLATRRLARLLTAERPTLVLSTYHLAGLMAAHLRQRDELDATVVSFVTTFGVHRLWIHPAVDRYLCISRPAALALASIVQAPVSVVEPVVRREFAPSEDLSCENRSDPPDAHVALLVAGALGLGDLEVAARTIAALPGWRPVAVCGMNHRLRRRIEAIPGAIALGWVDDMAGLMRDATVVLDNAAGSTAKEAISLGRPVVTFRPISGHGRHDAQMMAQLGCTTVVDDPDGLASELQSLLDPRRRAERMATARALFGRDPAPLIARFAGARARSEVA